MTLKSCVKSCFSNEGKVINLNKIVHEKSKENPLKLLEKAKELSEDPKINIQIRIYTRINLSSFYAKEGFEFKSIKILTQELEFLICMNEFI